MERDTKIKIAVVNDTLSVDEMKKLLQCTREIERNKQGRIISVFLPAAVILAPEHGAPPYISDITITAGDTLSVDELKKIVQCIREIEQNKPVRHINVLMDTPEKTVKEMEEVTDSVKPGFPFKTVIEFKKDAGT